MNWKHFLLYLVGAPILASANQALVSNASGIHTPITMGTVLLPAAMIALKSLAALFTPAPTQTVSAPITSATK